MVQTKPRVHIVSTPEGDEINMSTNGFLQATVARLHNMVQYVSVPYIVSYSVFIWDS